jgi:hypothetical protein
VCGLPTAHFERNDVTIICELLDLYVSRHVGQINLKRNTWRISWIFPVIQMPQPIDFRSATKIPRKSYTPRFMRRYFRVWERLKNYRVPLSFLLDDIDDMNMYFVRLVGWIATRIHDSSSRLSKAMVATLLRSSVGVDFAQAASD